MLVHPIIGARSSSFGAGNLVLESTVFGANRMTSLSIDNKNQPFRAGVLVLNHIILVLDRLFLV